MAKAQYSDHLVSYIDLLGFKAIVSERGEPFTDLLNAILSVFERSSELARDVARDIKVRTFCLSDFIIRAAPTMRIDGKVHAGTLLGELRNLAHIQTEMMMKGISLRGGLAIGPLYMEKRRIFGPGLIEAYGIEQGRSNYPRIVIDRRVFANMIPGYHRHRRRQEGVPSEEIKALVRRDFDGERYLDYLRGAAGLHRDARARLGDILREHRDVIDRSLRDLDERRGRQLQKWSWIMSYHNAVLDEARRDRALAPMPDGLRLDPDDYAALTNHEQRWSN